MKQRALIIDNAGKRIHQVGYCLRASQQFEIYALIHSSIHNYLKYSRFIKKVIKHNHKDEDLLNFTIGVCKEHKIDIIFGLSLKEIDFLITYKDQFPKDIKIQLLPNRDVFDLTNDKEQLAQFLHQHNLSGPVTWSPEILQKNSNEITFPALLKPKKGEGGMGIFKCENLLELNRKITEISSKDYIIQDFIQGYDIDCSILAKDGKILFHTIQRGIEESKYNEFSPCSAIEFLNVESLYNLVANFIEKVNFSGIAHLDLRYNQVTGEYVIIEINSRYWDTLIGSFLVAKVNFPYLHAIASLDMSQITPNQFNHGVFVTSRAYFLYKTNRLKIPQKNSKIELRHSGLYIQLLDPIYFILNFF